jgi:hypothetical protein
MKGGIANLGNTCYLNAALQALACCVEAHEIGDPVLRGFVAGQESVERLARQLNRMQKLDDVFRENDSHEMFGILMELCGKGVSRRFEGKLNTSSLCRRCGLQTSTDECFTHLPCEAFHEAVRGGERSEHVTDAKCDRCKIDGQLLRLSRVVRLPNLCVVLNCNATILNEYPGLTLLACVLYFSHHYVAVVKKDGQGWFLVDDTRIKPIGENLKTFFGTCGAAQIVYAVYHRKILL